MPPADHASDLPSRRELRALASREIVARTTAKHLLFKWAGQVLEERPPDEDAGADLVRAYRSGTAPPWMTAYLLGCVRARCGYDVVREILVGAPGSLAESYAGPAMARIAPEKAKADLLELMDTAATLQSREGAAYGIGELQDRALLPFVHDALKKERIRRGTAASVVRALGAAHREALGWLRSEDDRDRALGIELSVYLLVDRGSCDEAFIASLRAAMKTVPLAPRVRRLIEQRIQE